jgi:LPPG:FO 2-phospho-L-lactate transferase
VARELCERFGVATRLVPATDDVIATVFDTVDGPMSFQEYFVARRHDVAVKAVTVEGAAAARPAPGVLASLRDAQRIVIAPSNPLISIGPILAVPGVADVLRERRRDVTAVSPLVGGEAIKGPAARLLRELGYDDSNSGVADYYEGLIGSLVIDEVDGDDARELRARGLDVRVTTSVMSNDENSRRLATAVVS